MVYLIFKIFNNRFIFKPLSRDGNQIMIKKKILCIKNY